MNLRLIAATVILLFVACKNTPEIEDEIRNDIGKFADSYFNYDLHKTLEYCTPESRKWIQYAASNIKERDLVVLRSQEKGAKTEIKDIEISDDDSTAVVKIQVSNFMQTDTIDSPGRMTDNTFYRIKAVKRNGRWLVRMEGLPRNEKSYRD